MRRFLILILAVSTITLGAQDFSFDEEVSGDDSFLGDSFGEDLLAGTGESPLEISGSLKIPFTLTPQWGSLDSLMESPWAGEALLVTDLDYTGSKADLHASLEALWSGGTLEPVLDEAYARLYMGNSDLEVGLRKITWGKGDGVHVMDVLNPMDYSEFIEPDYNDRKQADLMVRLNLAPSDISRLELVYMPWFTPDTQALEGDWMQADSSVLLSEVEIFMSTYAVNYYNQDPTSSVDDGLNALATAAKMAEAEENMMRLEDTTSLKYAQGGVRFTQTLGPLDWGIAVVKTYMRDPVVSKVDFNTAPAAALTIDPHISVKFTPMYMLAEEAAMVIGGFNFRYEGAFSLTEDYVGDNPDLKNPRLDWIFGFDHSLPISNLSINLQGKGQYIMLSDKIAASDPEFSDRYYSHMLIASIKDSWFHDTLDITVAGSVNIEDRDFLIRPQLDYHFKESATLGMGYRWYEGDPDTIYGQFDDLDRLILTVEMNF